jgi:hypothetical protein
MVLNPPDDTAGYTDSPGSRGSELRFSERLTDANKMWWLLLIFALGLGLARAPWWTAPLPAIGLLALGFEATANEAPNYDMHGFGTTLGIIGAFVSLILWFAGWGIAWAVKGPPDRDRARRARRTPSDPAGGDDAR